MLTLCPITLAVGCKKCPAFRICPVKGSIGDYKPPAEAAPAAPARAPRPPAKSARAKPKARVGGKRPK